MTDLIKSSNVLVNSLLFPGGTFKSTYHTDTCFWGMEMIFIPLTIKGCIFPRYLPSMLSVGRNNEASIFCIHFKGNACDIGQAAIGAIRESYYFDAHYLVVEYPGYGIMGGFPSEISVDDVARAAYFFVIDELKVPPAQIVLIGRSLGTGPTCSLAAFLEREKRTAPGAIILHAPYCSLRAAAQDLVGCISHFMIDRWMNWKHLCGDVNLYSDGAEIDESVASGDGEVLIQCPVLFIHADCDQVIDPHHSFMMHAARKQKGLPSELYTQKSSGEHVKTHNFFDYDEDYIFPVREFLHKVLPTKPRISLPLDILEGLKSIPNEYKDIRPQESKCTLRAGAMWGLCPFTFCLEGCVACCEGVGREAAAELKLLPRPGFAYATKSERNRDTGPQLRMVGSFLRTHSLEALVYEEVSEAVRNPVLNQVSPAAP